MHVTQLEKQATNEKIVTPITIVRIVGIVVVDIKADVGGLVGSGVIGAIAP